MTSRSIIIHAGFHKTGTTNLQQTLRANRGALRPDIRLVLRPGMVALCASARAYSLSREDYDLGLVKYEAALLVEALEQEMADTIILSSQDLGGHMPGRHGLHGYGATPHLMRALAIAIKMADPDAAVTFFFTTRAAGPWLRSCYAQHLQSMRMIWGESDYIKRFKTSAELDHVINLVKHEVPEHPVVSATLEDHASRRLGIAEALLDHLEIDAKRRGALAPSALRNAALPDLIRAQMLALNRSDLDPAALKKAKRDLIEGAS
jgi:hypothetical protein